VKLTQEKVIEPVATTSNVAAPVKKVAAKKIVKTITCTKGKFTRKVSGTAPKCPAGYRSK
jgi:hypothetical protein